MVGHSDVLHSLSEMLPRLRVPLTERQDTRGGRRGRHVLLTGNGSLRFHATKHEQAASQVHGPPQKSLKEIIYSQMWQHNYWAIHYL